MNKLEIYEGNINDTKFVKIDKLNGLNELQELLLTEDWIKIVTLLQKQYEAGEISRFSIDNHHNAEVRVQAVGSSIFYKFVVKK